jgi:hypothetical protein
MMQSMAQRFIAWVFMLSAILAWPLALHAQADAPKDDWLKILGSDKPKTPASPPPAPASPQTSVTPTPARPSDTTQGAIVDVEGFEAISMATGPEARTVGSRTAGWLRLPDFLGPNTKVYSVSAIKGDEVAAGISKVKVRQSGLMLIACHFGYEGNLSGGWRETTLTLEQVQGLGFKPVGLAIGNNGREYVLMSRMMKAGEQMDLRVNKFDAPFVILRQSFALPAPTPALPPPVSARPLDYGSPMAVPSGPLTVNKVVGFAPVPMSSSKKISENQPLWPQLPDKLKDATIFSADPPPPSPAHGAAADFTVEANGILYLACQAKQASYNPYEGRVSLDELTQAGWTATGEIKDDKDNTFQLFYKEVKTGEKYRIRTHRTAPVYVIVNGKR